MQQSLNSPPLSHAPPHTPYPKLLNTNPFFFIAQELNMRCLAFFVRCLTSPSLPLYQKPIYSQAPRLDIESQE